MILSFKLNQNKLIALITSDRLIFAQSHTPVPSVTSANYHGASGNNDLKLLRQLTITQNLADQ
jgi:hypothetical protein